MCAVSNTHHHWIRRSRKRFTVQGFVWRLLHRPQEQPRFSSKSSPSCVFPNVFAVEHERDKSENTWCYGGWSRAGTCPITPRVPTEMERQEIPQQTRISKRPLSQYIENVHLTLLCKQFIRLEGTPKAKQPRSGRPALPGLVRHARGSAVLRTAQQRRGSVCHKPTTPTTAAQTNPQCRQIPRSVRPSPRRVPVPFLHSLWSRLPN